MQQEIPKNQKHNYLGYSISRIQTRELETSSLSDLNLQVEKSKLELTISVDLGTEWAAHKIFFGNLPCRRLKQSNLEISNKKLDCEMNIDMEHKPVWMPKPSC